MSRLHRSVGVILLTSALCLGMSAGPVMADDTGSSPPTTTVQPAGQPATPAPGISTPATPTPTTSAPTSQPTTTPKPDPSTPAQPPESEQPTTTAEPTEPAVTPPEPTNSEQQPTPAPDPATEEDKADLQLAVWFDKPNYLGHEVITAHARVTNAGSAPASQAKLTSTGNLNTHDWWPYFSTGTLVEPGQAVEFRLAGRPTTTDAALRLVVTVQDLSGQEDANPADNTLTATVPVTFVYGSFRGTVYGDRDGSNTMDPGEALVGVTATAYGGNPYTTLSTVTDSSGRFTFVDLPTGSYAVLFSSAEWYIEDQRGEVDGTGDPDLLLRSSPLVGSAVSVSTRFTQPTYQLNDLAHVTMTVANNGTYPLMGLTIYCWATGSPQIDTGAFGGAGLTVPAGATRTVDMTLLVNDGAFSDGYVTISTYVGAPPFRNGRAANATARVLGGMAPRVVGYLKLFRWKPMLGRPYGDPLPGIKVYLRSPETGKIVARAVTEDDGRFTFFNLPTDHYEFGVVGPWRIYWPSSEFPVRNGETGWNWEQWHYIFVMPGPDQPDPEPERPVGQPPPTPAPGPGDTAPQTKEAGLAWTGANVLWLAVGGLIALTAGAGLILHGRRRSAG